MEALAIVLVVLAVGFTVAALVSKAKQKKSANHLIVSEERKKLTELETVAPLSEKPKPVNRVEREIRKADEKPSESDSGKVILKGAPEAPKQDVEVFFKMTGKNQTWICPRCEFRNEMNVTECSLCGLEK